MLRLELNELFTLDDNIRRMRGHSWKLQTNYISVYIGLLYFSLIELSIDGIRWISRQLVLPASMLLRGA